LKENDGLTAELNRFSDDLVLLCPALVSHAVLLLTVFFLQGQPLMCFTAGTELGLMLAGSKCSERRWLSDCASVHPLSLERLFCSHSLELLY